MRVFSPRIDLPYDPRATIAMPLNQWNTYEERQRQSDLRRLKIYEDSIHYPWDVEESQRAYNRLLRDLVGILDRGMDGISKVLESDTPKVTDMDRGMEGRSKVLERREVSGPASNPEMKLINNISRLADLTFNLYLNLLRTINYLDVHGVQADESENMKTFTNNFRDLERYKGLKSDTPTPSSLSSTISRIKDPKTLEELNYQLSRVQKEEKLLKDFLTNNNSPRKYFPNLTNELLEIL